MSLMLALLLFLQSGYAVSGKADATLADRTHVAITLTLLDSGNKLVPYDRWVETAEWQKDPKLVIGQMAKFKYESMQKEAANTVASVSDTPKTMTKAEAEQKVSDDEAAKAAEKKAAEDKAAAEAAQAETVGIAQ